MYISLYISAQHCNTEYMLITFSLYKHGYMVFVLDHYTKISHKLWMRIDLEKKYNVNLI